MKSKIKKFWGLGLIVTLLASLAVAAVPVSAADPLAWNGEAIPTIGGNVLGPAGVDVMDIAVSSDGATIWAAPGNSSNNTVYKSTNGGATWSAVTVTVGPAAMDADLVAIAPDDSNLVAVADRWADDGSVAACTIYISTNGGAIGGGIGGAGMTIVLFLSTRFLNNGQNCAQVSSCLLSIPDCSSWEYRIRLL